MKILYTFRSLAVWGGIERVLVEKMNHLVCMYNYDVYMLTTGQGTHSVPYYLEEKVWLDDLGIQFHKQYIYSGFRRLWNERQRTRLFEKRLSEKIQQIQPDVIVCTTADPVYSIAKVKGCIPLIVESHSICLWTLGVKSFHQKYMAYLLKKGLKKVTCLVSLTEGDAKDWKKICSHVEVIPNIVHLNKGPIASLDNKRVIWVGRFDYQKCPLEVIKIWQMIYPQFPNWHLDMYGEGEQRYELENAVKHLNINIHIHEPTAFIFDAYRRCSILISTSTYEPFGLVLPEAMSTGLPVVAYDCPYGPADIIIDGVNGYLVKDRNEENFVYRVCCLIENESLRHRMGKNGIVSSQKYRASLIMPQWVNLFKEIVKK